MNIKLFLFKFVLLFLTALTSGCLSKDDGATDNGGGTGGGNSTDEPGSIRFDGLLKYIEVPASWLTGDFTICLWIKPQSVAGNTLLSMSSGDKYFYLSYDNNELDWKMESSDDTDMTIDATTSFVVGNTYQVCVTADYGGTGSRAYVNGVQVSGIPAALGSAPAAAHTVLTLGRDPAPGFQAADGNKTLPFEGDMDNVMIWKRVLPANAITQLYASGVGFDPRYAFGNYTAPHVADLEIYYLMGNDPDDVISDPGAVLIDQMGNQNATPVDFDAVDYGEDFW